MMFRNLVCILATFLLAGCSRSGHHPDPIAPETPRSPYDIEAGNIRFLNDEHIKRSQPPVNRNKDIRVAWEINNIGTETIPSQMILLTVLIDGKVSSYGFSNPDPVRPGKAFAGGKRGAFARYFEEARQYEIKLKVRLPSKLGETNLDNNEFTRFIEVTE